MILSNRAAILILGCIVGGVISVGQIGSESYLLATLDPLYLVFLTTLACLVFSFALPRIDLKRIKFATFGVIATIIWLGLFAGIRILPISDEVLAASWFFLVISSSVFHHWLLSELALKHLNPAIATSALSYLATAYEVGTLLAVGLLKISGYRASPEQVIIGMMFGYAVIAVVLLVQFGPRQNFEIRFGTALDKTSNAMLQSPVLKRFAGVFVVVCAAIGAFQVAAMYAVSVVLKSELHSYDAISAMMLNYYLIGSGISVVLGIVLGNLIQRYRLSPLWLLGAYIGVSLGMAVIAWTSPVLLAFVALEIARRVGLVCCYSVGTQMMLSSFVGAVKRRLRSRQDLYDYAFVGLPLVALFSVVSNLAPSSERWAAMGMVTVSLLVAIWGIGLMYSRFVTLLYEMALSGNKVASVSAVQMLSFVRPRDYHARMNAILIENPKKVLRKTIIVGLGYCAPRESDPVDTILTEFKSDKEEIQIAVLDALNVAHRYKAIQFLANVMMAREASHSLRVRMNAAAIIAGLYGKKAIPFLLNGLEDEDERIVANTLEVLSVFKDPTLVPFFLRHLTSAAPRVRCNALMGLAKYRSVRSEYRDQARAILESSDGHLVSSMLYVVGKLRDKSFGHSLTRIVESDLLKEPMVRRAMAWALTRLNDVRGFDLFGELFQMTAAPGKDQPYMHFFSQLTRSRRFILIKSLTARYHSESEFIRNLGNTLRASNFDFHEELEYMRLLLESLGESVSVAKSAPVG